MEERGKWRKMRGRGIIEENEGRPGNVGRRKMQGRWKGSGGFHREGNEEGMAWRIIWTKKMEEKKMEERRAMGRQIE